MVRSELCGFILRGRNFSNDLILRDKFNSTPDHDWKLLISRMRSFEKFDFGEGDAFQSSGLQTLLDVNYDINGVRSTSTMNENAQMPA